MQNEAIQGRKSDQVNVECALKDLANVKWNKRVKNKVCQKVTLSEKITLKESS